MPTDPRKKVLLERMLLGDQLSPEEEQYLGQTTTPRLFGTRPPVKAAGLSEEEQDRLVRETLGLPPINPQQRSAPAPSPDKKSGSFAEKLLSMLPQEKTIKAQRVDPLALLQPGRLTQEEAIAAGLAREEEVQPLTELGSLIGGAVIQPIGKAVPKPHILETKPGRKLADKAVPYSLLPDKPAPQFITPAMEAKAAAKKSAEETIFDLVSKARESVRQPFEKQTAAAIAQIAKLKGQKKSTAKALEALDKVTMQKEQTLADELERLLFEQEDLHPFLSKDLKGTAKKLAKTPMEDVPDVIQKELTRESELFFVRSLPKEERLSLAIDEAVKGKTLSTKPMTATTGSLSPAAEVALEDTFGKSMTMLFNRVLLPETVLGKEAGGKALFEAVKRSEQRYQRLSQAFGRHVEKITNGLDDTALEAIGRKLDGQGVVLGPKEEEVAVQLKRLYDRLADVARLPAGRRISEYFPHFFDPKTGHPIDIIRIVAGQTALADAQAGKLAIQLPAGAGHMAESTLAQAVWEQLDDISRGEYLTKARTALQGRPAEAFFGQISKKRRTLASPDSFNARDITLRYIQGLARKVSLDELLNTHKQLLGAGKLSPALARYSFDYIDSFRGVLRSRQQMASLGLQELAMKADELGHTIKGRLLREIDPQRLSATARQAQYMSKIGGNVATALVNLTQTAINTVSEVGVIPTMRAAMQYINPAKHKQTKLLLERAGIAFQPIKFEAGEGVFSNLSDFLGWMFKQSEEFNRGVAFLAGYSLARGIGKPLSEAVKIGQDIVDKTQFVFSKRNIPLAMQNPVVAVLLQFKSYALNQFKFITQTLLSNPLEKDALGTRNAAKQIRLLAAAFLVGGAKSWIPYSQGINLASHLREEEYDEFLSDFILGGIPRAVLNADISESVGLFGLMPVVPNSPIDLKRTVREISGPTFSTLLEASGVLDAPNLWVAASQGDPDAQRKLFNIFLKSMPAGVQMERTYSAMTKEIHPGFRSRPLVLDTPQDKIIRAILGARTKSISKAIESLEKVDRTQQQMLIQKKALEEELLNRIEEWYNDTTGKVAGDILAKYEGIPTGDLDALFRKRHIPLLARDFESLPVFIKNAILRDNPKLFEEIMKELEKGEQTTERKARDLVN